MPKLAYAFYATNDLYGVAVLITIKTLKSLGARADADMVVLHLGLSSHLLTKFSAWGVKTLRVEPLPFVRIPHYRDCLVKLRIFELTDYDRIIYVEADTLVLQNLNELFSRPLNGALAAPKAYWLPDRLVTSVLLVTEPNKERWAHLRNFFPELHRKSYADMDLINEAFAGEIEVLPANYACLDSEWEDVSRPSYFNTTDTVEADIKMVHFTSLAKPWTLTAGIERFFRPKAHVEYHNFRSRWRAIRRAVFKDDPYTPMSERIQNNRLAASGFLPTISRELRALSFKRISTRAK